MPKLAGLGDVAALGGVDGVKVADTFAMFRVLTVRDVDDVVEDDRGADDLVAGFRLDRVFRVEVEFPELLAGFCLEPAYPAVTLSDDDLHHVANPRDRR